MTLSSRTLSHTFLPDTAICDDCLRELFDPTSKRYLYPYIGCPNCGPRYVLMTNLPFERKNTTMAEWEICPSCKEEYEDPQNRRYHAELNCCPDCGPNYYLTVNGERYEGEEMFRRVAELLKNGEILLMKNNGGYHLVCDAFNKEAVQVMRDKLGRPRKSFAIMVKDVEAAKEIVHLSEKEEEILLSKKRPILIAKSKSEELSSIIAPNNPDIGLMVPYTGLQHLLFHFGSPRFIVMTSANYPGEPTIHKDDQLTRLLEDFQCAVLIGEREIERSVDDTVLKVTKLGAVPFRRSRGYNNLLNITLPSSRPILTLGADLKSTITLVKDGHVIMSHHLGDTSKYGTQLKFERAVKDYLNYHGVALSDTIIGHDLHPEYFTTKFAQTLEGYRHVAVQHHKAHLASILALKNKLSEPVVGVIFDGAGYGEDGEIWGGEIFVGSVQEGFARRGHLRKASLIGGDAAATFPLQALAGFIGDFDKELLDRLQLPEPFPKALKIKEKNIRTFPTTSVGRLFDAVAALTGFHLDNSFEGEAAIGLEYLAGQSPIVEEVYPFPWTGEELDYRPLFEEMIQSRLKGTSPSVIARGFHRSLAQAVVDVITALCKEYDTNYAVLSGGVFHNSLLVSDIFDLLKGTNIEIFYDDEAPLGDNCISLGQAAILSAMNND
ncbi:carbamoyltransferase HypF [Ureibacillus terrenus]|uniref:carbamoyltransferase HypF n=1 Tax=Ureibacillus terrenus TaxID=118246 RepID=UPI002E1BC6CD|nr:carbamoyltransferase HypF [Ureibacillus terrenus]